ncbi:uncharacterized protein (TIGR00661 family) [Gillisia sp. Hel_I_86]|uniref:glycosyltransferase family protein n=1 Tax=Gillisia sp. Hel_I_86 TaxID=1249981 RepID=UPI001199D67C|nr:glycosyltransferase family protein [Gillisia sp. Hel_I_86]TVZ25866.1 uncharacterized protein (TIGR00661 family) [Gillisia sp. Hel_I_86]
MRILYAIQGTGNGHLCRALDIVPILQKKGEVDILISGTQADIVLPYKIKYRFKGLSFVFGKKGGVDLWQTWRKNDSRRFLLDIKKLPLEEYDLVINDFEPVSAWSAVIKRATCFSLSHQAAVLAKNAPMPLKKDPFGRFILKKYAPAKKAYGFHFSEFNHNIFTPVIRKQVRQLKVTTGEHYTVYLPSYSDKKLVKILGRFPKIKWEVFSKHNKKDVIVKNIHIQPIHNERFLNSLASCKGVVCGAGFETPAEVLFLRKKLLVVPMKNQYEQHCNAAALKGLGVCVLENLKKKRSPEIGQWLKTDKIIEMEYPDKTEDIIDLLFGDYQREYIPHSILSFPPKPEAL